MSFIGENIKSFRKSRGYTQAELAEKCNVATITIRQYENGKREPNSKMIHKLAVALDVAPIYLACDYSEEPDELPSVLEYLDVQKSIYSIAKNIDWTAAKLLSTYIRLNDKGRSKALEQVTLLEKVPEYKKESPEQDQTE